MDELLNTSGETSRTLGGIRNSSKTNCISAVVSAIRRNQYDLSPYWQRNDVWKENRKSNLIESILLGLPLPSIFVMVVRTPNSSKTKFEVIDGKQRLSAIKEFANGEFALSKLEMLPNLTGKRYSDLNDDEREQFENYGLNFNEIESTDPDVKFNMFERLNSGGVKLNEQELRHCVYRGPLMEMVSELAEYEPFVELMGRKTEDTRMCDEQTVLGILAFKEILIDNHGYLRGPGDLKDRISIFCHKYQHAEPNILQKMASDFKFSCRAVGTIWGFQKNAFRNPTKPKGKTNAVVIRVQMLSVLKYKIDKLQMRADAIVEAFSELCADSQFNLNVSRATGNLSQNRDCFFMWAERLACIMETPSNSVLEKLTSNERVRFSSEQRNELWESSDKVCYLCGNTIHDISQMEVDHVVPISKGGSNSIENLRVTHAVCNNKKNNTLILENVK